MIRIKQEPLSPPPALSSLRSASPSPPRVQLSQSATAASTADDVAWFLIAAEGSACLDVRLMEQGAEAEKNKQPASEAAQGAAEESDDSECELIPEEDQLDPDDPTVWMNTVCPACLARIRQYWKQELRSIHVKQEAEQQAALEVIQAYDDLDEEGERGEDDSEGSDDGHQSWCEESDWDSANEDSDDAAADSEESSEERVGVMGDREEEHMRQYRRWRTGAEQGESDDEPQDEEYQEEEGSNEALAAASDDDEASSGGGSEEVKEEQSRWLSRAGLRSSGRPLSRLTEADISSLQHAQATHTEQRDAGDISDILCDGPTFNPSSHGRFDEWTVFEDGSEGWAYDAAKEAEWIKQEMGGKDGGVSAALCQSAAAVGGEKVQAALAADESDEDVKQEGEENDEDGSEDEQSCETQQTQARQCRTQPRAAEPSSRSRKRQSRARELRPARHTRTERKKTVRTEVTTIRKTRTTSTTNTRTVRHSWRDSSNETDDDSDTSPARARPPRHRQQRTAKRKRCERETRTDERELDEHSLSAEEEEDEEKAAEMEVDEATAGGDGAAECTVRRTAVGRSSATTSEYRSTDAIVCMECGEAASDEFGSGMFCSSLCQQWVAHKRFLSAMHRSMNPITSQQHDQYYQPMHNLPLYPVTTGLLPCQQPFALLATEPLDRNLPIVRGYLAHQLSLQPALRLGPSLLHGTGVFTTRPIAARTRLLTIYGLLYPRSTLLDESDRFLPITRHRRMNRLIDVDALDTGDISLLMSISKACVAGYVNSVRGVVVAGRRQNVRFDFDVRVRGWVGEGWVPSGLMIVTSVCDIVAGEELLENYPY